MIDFSDKKVFITGGSSGIGAACVKLFAELNAKVGFSYNSNYEAALNLKNDSPQKNNIEFYKCNFNNALEAEKDIKNIIEDFGDIDILINNAGIWTYGESDAMRLDTWEDTITVNLTSMFLFTRAAIPAMKKKKYGKIINISSTAGQRGEAFHSHYAASKGGMISFTKALAVELGEYNINVNSVAPGWVYTPMNDKVFSDKEFLDTQIENIPLKRIASAEDIAGPVIFLASELARHITGEILNVNGGSVLCG